MRHDGKPEVKHRHRYHSPWRRGLVSLLLIGTVLAVGTVGFRLLEGLRFIDAFFYISMIATGQGLTRAPVTAAGKVFASAMAFVSIGTVVTAGGFLFGPFLGQMWRIGHERWEEEIRLLKGDREKRRE